MGLYTYKNQDTRSFLFKGAVYDHNFWIKETFNVDVVLGKNQLNRKNKYHAVGTVSLGIDPGC
jgi:hypothetical protein